MHHQPTTQTNHPPPSSFSATALHPIPCISSDFLRHPLLRAPPRYPPPRNTRPSQPSRIPVYPTLHFSSTLRTLPLPPWHHRRARSPAATTTFLYSPPRRHAGSTKRDCCYVALGDQQVSPSSSSSKTKTALRCSLSHHFLAPLSLSHRPASFQPTVSRNGNAIPSNIRIFYIR